MKRNSRTHSFGGAGLTALLLFVLQQLAFGGMAVSPLQQRVEVKPGKTTTFSLTVSNTNRGPETVACTVNVDLLDFNVSDKGKIFFGTEYKHPRSAVDWISFEDEKFVLEPGDSREIKLKVSPPLNADGDYWAAAMIGLGNSEKPENGVQVKVRTASGIFIHVARRNYIERGSVIDSNIILPEFEISENLIEGDTSELALDEGRKNQMLIVNAELKNDGLIGFLARGKAYLYSDGWRRIATIPLYSSRRRVLPGDRRWFSGVMTQPLPAGQYKLRTFFAADSKYGRKMTRDMEFSVSEDKARNWAENFVNDDSTQTLEIKPQQIELELNPGRLTAARFLVANKSLGTVVTSYQVQGEQGHKDWLELKTTDFAFAPNMQRSMTCIVKVPADAKPGKYNWVIGVDAERSGLTVQGKDNVEQLEIPVCVVIGENNPILLSKQK
ncbi:hypothetical protein ACFL3G_12835 [Planctomycetota bacterium]